jgi:Mg2+-importing ATPase
MCIRDSFGNMFSAAAASAFLPFLPMLPGQILLNNFLYDASQMAIPSDRVDSELLARPSSWNMSVIRRFMLLLGPISSLFDFLTFAVMLKIFAADPQLFRSGWFVESLATQTLVVFIIRTRRRPFFRSRPGIALSISVIAVVIIGAFIPQSWLGAGLGFAPLSIGYFGILAAMVVVYLVLVDALKRFALSSASGNPPTRVLLK